MIEDITGRTFGSLTVLGAGERDRRGKPTWRCRCACGETVSDKYYSDLCRGRVMSCGRSVHHAQHSNPAFIDMTGQKYGRLTCLRRDGRYWLCMCECGNESRADGNSLRSGHTVSCGCWNTEVRSRQAAAIGAAKVVNLSGDVFGRLTVEGRATRPHGTEAHWQCVCQCGERIVVCGSRLRDGLVTSCGCGRPSRLKATTVNRDRAPARRDKHGMSNTPEYRIWRGMIQRCTNPNRARFARYGARGIRVCEEWLGAHGFELFLSHMGPRPSAAHSIDRYPNNDGNYEPGNVRWATRREQDINKSSAILVAHGGRTMLLSEWIRELGLVKRAVYKRVADGTHALVALGLIEADPGALPETEPSVRG